MAINLIEPDAERASSLVESHARPADLGGAREHRIEDASRHGGGRGARSHHHWTTSFTRSPGSSATPALSRLSAVKRSRRKSS